MKTAIVTGAGGDIGKAISEKLISADWQICGFDINEQKLSNTRTHLADDDKFAAVACDVRSMSSVLNAVQQAQTRFGAIDALINNAGAISTPTLLTTTEKSWLGDIDLNLNGAWRCIHALQQQFIKQESGVILNIASVNGLGIFGHPGYSVAKAGLIHLTRFCASEFGKYGVRSIAICPGTVKTQAWRARLDDDPSILEKAIEWYPSRGLCEPDDIANFVELLVRSSMSQLNGAVISLDGGPVSRQRSDRVSFHWYRTVILVRVKICSWICYQRTNDDHIDCQ